jgi:regulatory protein
MTTDSNKSARQWALRALGRRMHTVYEISVSLSKRGFADDVVENLVEELAGQGYIDDLNFARMWVASRSAHQFHGRLRLLKDLRQKGIPDEIIDSVLGESCSDKDEAVVAIKAIEKKRRTLKTTGAKGRDALYRHLRSKGFTTRAISLAMDGLKLMDQELVHQNSSSPLRGEDKRCG